MMIYHSLDSSKTIFIYSSNQIILPSKVMSFFYTSHIFNFALDWKNLNNNYYLLNYFIYYWRCSHSSIFFRKIHFDFLYLLFINLSSLLLFNILLFIKNIYFIFFIIYNPLKFIFLFLFIYFIS